MLTVAYSVIPNSVTSIEFSITNTSQNKIYVLYWNSILDALCPNAIVIKNKEEEICEYRGPRAKRIFQPDDSLVAIEAGATIRQVLNLSQNYSLPADDFYSIQLRDPYIKGFEEDDTKVFSLETFEQIKVTMVACSAVRLLPSISRNHLPDAGTIVNNAPPLCMPPLCVAPSYSGDPICVLGKVDYTHALIHNSVGSQTEIIRKAVDKLFSRQGGGKPIKVDNDAIFAKWFGTFNEESAIKVQHLINGIKSQAKCKWFEFYVMNSCDKPDTAAFFLKSAAPSQNDMLGICRKYFLLATSGYDSQSGTLAHELSHGYAGTQDHAYGAAKCIALAKTQPMLALENADSIEYYFEEKAL